MLIKKEIFVNGKKAILSYDDSIFNKDADQLISEGIIKDFKVNAEILFTDYQIKTCLTIGEDEYYDEDESKEVKCFCFEVVDMDNFDNELCCSYSLHETISNEKELIHLLAEESHFINNTEEFKRCPKGYVLGYCDEKASAKCEFSALSVEGLCGAECQDCFGEMLASKEDGAYVCDCSRIFFEDRHHGFRGIE